MNNQPFAVLGLACMLTMLALQVAGAQEVGNPVTLTPKGRYSLGLAANYVFEKKHAGYDLRADDSRGGGSVYDLGGKFENDQHHLLGLAYGLSDWLNIFVQAGVVHGGKFISPNAASGEEWEAKLKDQFVWAVGAKARAFKLANGLALGLAARYLRYDDRGLGLWHENHSGYDDGNDWTTDLKIDYWQLDLTAALSLTLGPFTPYAGVGYTYSEAKEHGRNYNLHNPYYIEYDATIKNNDNLLALCGLDLALGQGFSLFLQGEFVARTALGLGLSWSF